MAGLGRTFAGDPAYSPYETLILDIGSGIDEIFQLLDMCRTVFMPVKPDRISRCKIAQFENLLRVLDYPRCLPGL